MNPRAVLLLAALLGGVAPAMAQGNLAVDSPSSSGEGEGGGAQAAHVGAGTTNGTTTGVSKPDTGESSPGPPELTADLCSKVVDTPAHADCLSKVLGEGAQP